MMTFKVLSITSMNFLFLLSNRTLRFRTPPQHLPSKLHENNIKRLDPETWVDILSTTYPRLHLYLIFLETMFSSVKVKIPLTYNTCLIINKIFGKNLLVPIVGFDKIWYTSVKFFDTILLRI